MEANMPTVLRPMSLGEILDQTFRLYRNHFVLFVGIAALPQLVILAFQTVVATAQTTGVMGTGGTKTIVVSVLGAIVALALYLAATTASMAATVVAVSNLHLDKPITIAEAYGRIRHSVLRLAGVIIGMTLGVMLGLVIFIIPGIILALKWALAIPVAVVEDAGLSVATSRSSDLTKGSKGRIFAVWFVVLALIWVVTILFGIPVGVIAATSASKGGQVPFWLEGVNSSLGFVVNSLCGPLLTIAISLMYFDERVRKEAFDLQVLMGSVGTTEAAASAQA
jgi:hypothetical protein